MSPPRVFAVFILGSFLFACSSIQQSHLRNFKSVFSPSPGVVLSQQELSKIDVDLINVKHGDRPLATMALAYIENDQYKWVSSDDVIFVTQAGRIVQTVGLDKNLVFTTNLQDDPLSQGANLTGDHHWQRLVDYDSQEYSLLIRTNSVTYKDVQLQVLGYSFDTRLIEEQADMQKNGHDYTLVNRFWFDTSSGELLKSSQQISESNDTIVITYLHRAMRLAQQLFE